MFNFYITSKNKYFLVKIIEAVQQFIILRKRKEILALNRKKIKNITAVIVRQPLYYGKPTPKL